MYIIEKNINKLKNNYYTNFLDQSELKQIQYKLTKNEYKIYSPYPESDKVILYNKELPKVSLYEIICNNNLRHQDIMGSLLNLNIDRSLFGDIIIYNNKYYFYVLDIINNYIESNFNKISKYNIKLKKIDINYLNNYKREYEQIQLITTSLRIDTIISKLSKTNRDKVKQLIKDKNIILNYTILKNNSYILKENDIFSIKKIGKYKYIGIKNKTKNNNYIIELLKYI